ncbi:MAG: hypothetical protein LC731_07935 [Acidobacteria bacterium]|nr:hypothetical protein [Acidobacteriota bacterium]
MASEQIKVIDAGGALVRAGLVLLTLAALFGGWRALRWYTTCKRQSQSTTGL